MIQLTTRGKWSGRSIEIATWGKFRQTWVARIIIPLKRFITKASIYYWKTDRRI